MELNPSKDLAIDTRDLTAEFKKLSLLLFRYYEEKANAERERDMAKLRYKEAKAKKYKELKNSGMKISEANIEAEQDTDPDVIKAEEAFVEASHTFSTWVGAVDSMKAKKDMCIQLGSDRRKEV